MDNQATFDQWCIVEIMGRQVVAGRVTEQTIAGQAFIRVDVPECDGRPAFTRFYGGGAIYAMTPVSEDVARMAIRRYEPEPVTVYIPELRQLAATNQREEIASEDELEDADEDKNTGFDPDDVPF